MITSKDNKVIKLASVLKSKKFQRKFNKCFVESIKIVAQLYHKNLLDTILVTEEKYDLVKDFHNINIEIVSSNIAKYLSDTITTDGVFAICNIPTNTATDYSRSLILDRIQDPSNLGAIIRSACAFGYKNIILIDSVFPFSTKCIRSSMGYVFDMNFIYLDYDGLSRLKSEQNLVVVTADMDGDILDTCPKYDNIAIVVGNEGRGVSEDIRKLSDKIVSIPMQNNVESLNASVSASIIMYKFK